VSRGERSISPGGCRGFPIKFKMSEPLLRIQTCLLPVVAVGHEKSVGILIHPPLDRRSLLQSVQ
jgi:hypothetical protein